MKKNIGKIKKWIGENQAEFWILLFVLAVAAFVRLYRISDYLTFLGDEGRDVIIVRRLLVEGHTPLIGPGTSIGQMYLGPFYYYMMAPALFLANFSPVGPAVQIAVLGIITVWFVWYVGREWFGKGAGLIAAGLYAIAPTVIIYSRSSWNPNIMPFFALLSVYAVWRVWREKEFGWMPVLGFSLAAVLQSHYIGLLLVPTLGIFWLMALKDVWRDKVRKLRAMRSTMWALIIFLLMMSPLLFFDIRHNWINSQAIYRFFAVRQETVSIRPWTAIPKIPLILSQVNSAVAGAKSVPVGQSLSVLFAAVVAVFLVRAVFGKKKLGDLNPAYYVLFSWLGFSLIGFGLFKQNIYDHYFGFIFAVPFFLIGSLISTMLAGGKIWKWLGAGAVVYLVVINIAASPLKKEPNRLMQRSINVSKVIERESGGLRFNLAVIAETNYEDGYKYFLLRDNYPVVDIDSQIPDTVTDQLFAVCELIPSAKCDPTHSPKAQVANFGWSKIEGSWDIDGAIVYKLLHTQ